MVIDPSLDALLPHREPICQHMNDDHAEALALLCGASGPSGKAARNAARGCARFDVEQGEMAPASGCGSNSRKPLSTPDEVRRAMVELVRATRALGQ